MTEYKDCFIYTKFCFCKKELKISKSFYCITMNLVRAFFRMKKKVNFHLRVRFVIR